MVFVSLSRLLPSWRILDLRVCVSVFLCMPVFCFVPCRPVRVVREAAGWLAGWLAVCLFAWLAARLLGCLAVDYRK